MMLTIAVCEDEAISRKQLLQILDSVKTEGELQITSFPSGEAFLLDFASGQYDLIFMDIYMANLSGVDTVTRLREIDKDVPVVFTTTSTEHALEAYRLNVAKYLEKPLKKNDVIECLKLASANRIIKKKITLSISGREHSFLEDDLLYLEQLNHTVVIHLKNHETLSCSGKLDDYSDSLLPPVFYRCHKSYLVNLSNVVKLDRKLKVFVMRDGSNAYIKRDNLKEAEIKLDTVLFEKLRKEF